MIILFDLDGTLIDSTEAILESFGVAFERFGRIAPPKEAITPMIGQPLSAMFAKLGVAESEVAAHVDAYKAHYRRISREKTVLLPGAEEAVEEASVFARLGIVTTKTGRYSAELLEHFGLMKRFEVLIGSEDVTHHKPHPEPIRKALARMGGDPSGAWMVGDTLLDVEAALAAGVRPFAVCCGYGSAESLETRCSDVAADALSAVREIQKRKSLL